MEQDWKRGSRKSRAKERLKKSRKDVQDGQDEDGM